jgi:hypothetical protein
VIRNAKKYVVTLSSSNVVRQALSHMPRTKKQS